MRVLYSQVTSDNLLIPKLKGKRYFRKNTMAHKWLSQRYPDHSKNLQRVKNNVNEYYAHGNLFAAMLKLDKSTYSYSYFDRDDALIKQAHVWEVGYVVAAILGLLHQTSKDSPVVQIREDTFNQFLLLVRENQGYRAEFLKNKRFTKWFSLSKNI